MLDTLSNLKTRLGISGTTYDTFLTNQMVLISDVIEAYCRRKFLEADYEQTFYRSDYAPSNMCELFHFPVSDITSIVEDEVTVDASTYRLNEPTGRIIRTDGTFFTKDVTVIEYTAGLEDCPTPVLSVLDSLVLERYNKKTAGVDLNFGSDVQRISIPGAISIDFDYSLSNNNRTSAYGSILGSQVNILDDYRSNRAVLGEIKLIYVSEIPESP